MTHTPKWRGLAALSLFVAITACGDTATAPAAAPPAPELHPQTVKRVQMPKGPNLTEWADFSYPTPGTLQTGTPWQICNDLRKQQPSHNSNQKQSLIYDDYNVLQTNPLRQYSGVVVSGRLSINFQGWVGTLSGQPVQCVVVTSAVLYQARNFPSRPGQSPSADQPAAFVYKGNGPNGGWNFGFCMGAACAADSAWIHVQVRADWFKPCYMDISVSNCMDHITLGGTVLFTNEDQMDFLDVWDVKIFANGWWTAYNYGGNGGKPYGYWRWGTTGYHLLESYALTTTPGFDAWNAGDTHWKLE